MASGLACLVADAGGSADLVEHRVTGLKFAPHCVASLTRGLEELVADAPQRQRLAAQGLAYAQTQDWETILARQLHVYAELLGQPAAMAGSRPHGADKSLAPAAWQNSGMPTRWLPSGGFCCCCAPSSSGRSAGRCCGSAPWRKR